MTTNEHKMVIMLKRILRCMILGLELPGRYAIADLIEEVESSGDNKDDERGKGSVDA